jgi:isoquinoline 1-oxidoreductase beta subunit
MFGGRLRSVDAAPAEAMPGVARVVRLETAVAVVADSYWHARQGLAALRPQYEDAGHGDVTSASIFAAFARALGTPAVPRAAAGITDVTTVTAEYRLPFLAHAAMEPLACTARVMADRAEVWAGVQDPLNARATAADALGLRVEQVRFTNLPMGGSFGRRTPFCLDYIESGVRIAKAMSPAPVKVVWSRENDIQHDYYRPAAMARFAGALDASGTPRAIACHYAGGGDRESLFMPYAIADVRAEAREAAHPVPLGWWRSVLNSQHGFFKESFIDELAHAAGRDPYRFRLGLLGDQPRFRAVLVRAAEMAGWGSPLPDGEGRGIALTESFGTVVGQVAHVAVSPGGALRVLEVDAVIDCGDVVNPDSAAAQAEGGMLFGLSAAMVGEITIAGGRVVQRNFHDHQMIRLADTPRLRVEFLRSDAHLGGLGEACVPPIAPAVTNAIFAATGIRVRDLPITRQNLARRTST